MTEAWVEAAHPHGQECLPGVWVDAYNADLRAEGGFVGDRASGARLPGDPRRPACAAEERGSGPRSASGRPRRSTCPELDRLLREGDAATTRLLAAAIDAFATEFAAVTRRFLSTDEWAGTQHVVVGGGLRGSRLGEMAIARAAELLAADGAGGVELRAIHHHPDEAGLVGSVHLVSPARLMPFTAMLAVDIGGTKARAGLIALRHAVADDLSAAVVVASDVWAHAAEGPSRDEAVRQIVCMLRAMVAGAEARGLRLAPVVGIGCPGLIRGDGSIARGGHNLPGDWEHPGFNLPQEIAAALPELGGAPTHVVLHQRCGGAGPERMALHARAPPVGRHDDRHRARQRALHQPGRRRPFAALTQRASPARPGGGYRGCSDLASGGDEDGRSGFRVGKRRLRKGDHGRAAAASAVPARAWSCGSGGAAAMTASDDVRFLGAPTLAFEGWLNVKLYTMQVGTEPPFRRAVEDHGSAVAVLPYDPVRKVALLVSMPRAPVRLSQADDVLEVPAGLIEGVDPLDCARREAMEEVRRRARRDRGGDEGLEHAERLHRARHLVPCHLCGGATGWRPAGARRARTNISSCTSWRSARCGRS